MKFPHLSKKKFDTFHNSVFVERPSLLSDTIHQFNLQPVDHVSAINRPDSKPLKYSTKQMRISKRNHALISERIGSSKALEYDINPFNNLFDGDRMSVTSGKSDMVTELEAYLKEEHWLEPISSSVLIVDFMSFVRSQNIRAYKNTDFKTLASFLFGRIFSQHTESAHIIFDSYHESSLKECTRQSRAQSQMHIAKIDDHTPLPKQMDRFWSSSSNKELFQHYIRHQFQILAEQSGKEMIVSGMLVKGNQDPALYCCSRGSAECIPELQCNIEEADQRLIKHIHWAGAQGFSSFTVESKDTDVLVLLVHYFKRFKESGVTKIWQSLGTGANKRKLPIHTLYQRIPKPLRNVLLACFVGTGCDYISKVGTKHGAIAAFPEKNLDQFGTVNLNRKIISQAEEYLVNVLKNNASETTFDQLRLSQYNKHLDLMDLPPDSQSIRLGHIPRWWFIVKKLRSIHDETELSLSPTDYGWIDIDGCLLPEKHLFLVPEGLQRTCDCNSKVKAKRCNGKKMPLQKETSELHNILWMQEIMLKLIINYSTVWAIPKMHPSAGSSFEGMEQNEATSYRLQMPWGYS